jgi:hypothetical protein
LSVKRSWSKEPIKKQQVSDLTVAMHAIASEGPPPQTVKTAVFPVNNGIVSLTTRLAAFCQSEKLLL